VYYFWYDYLYYKMKIPLTTPRQQQGHNITSMGVQYAAKDIENILTNNL
jgi:hypothetical protein